MNFTSEESPFRTSSLCFSMCLYTKKNGEVVIIRDWEKSTQVTILYKMYLSHFFVCLIISCKDKCRQNFFGCRICSRVMFCNTKKDGSNCISYSKLQSP